MSRGGRACIRRTADRRLALFLHVRAARMEGATHRRVDRRGRVAREDDAAAVFLALGIGDGHGADQRLRVRMQRTLEHLHRRPDFHDPPRYITAMRSEMCLTTERSCEMKIIVSSISRVSRMSRLMICAWMDTSSALTGSSAMMSLRLDGEGARDGDALALAAAEFVRIFADVARREAHAFQQRRHLARHVAAGDVAVRGERLGERVVDRHARIERRIRVLENHLEIRPRVRRSEPCKLARFLPASTTLPPVGGMSCRIVRPSVDLPQPDSPTSPSTSPFLSERSIPSTALTVPIWLLDQETLFNGKMRLEIGNVEKGVGGGHGDQDGGSGDQLAAYSGCCNFNRLRASARMSWMSLVLSSFL